MRKRRYNHNVCERCRCILDAGEGRYCDECRKEMEQEEALAREWEFSIAQARRFREKGTIAV